jgi:hypothetical protein
MTAPDVAALAAALCDLHTNWFLGGALMGRSEANRIRAERLLAAIPPDPRLDALLAAARDALGPLEWRSEDAIAIALRDALAAFEEPV